MGFIGAALTRAGVEHIWPSGADPVFANSVTPGTSTRVHGGYRVSGRWKMVTGIRRADWLVALGAVDSTDEHRIFVIPANRIDIHDTWCASGMRATGSCDASGDGVFVPTELSAPLTASARIDRPPYRGYLPALMFAGSSAVTLGTAARLIDETVALVRTKPAGTGGVVGDATRTQYLVAKARAGVDAPRLLLLSTAADVQDARGAEVERRACLRAAMAHATEVTRGVLTDIYQLVGSSGLYRNKPVERFFRDGLVATQHAGQSAHFMAAAGRVRLGMAPGPAVF